jgi:hypothetical protein
MSVADALSRACDEAGIWLSHCCITPIVYVAHPSHMQGINVLSMTGVGYRETGWQVKG